MKSSLKRPLIRNKLMSAFIITASTGIIFTSLIFTLFTIVRLKGNLEKEMRAHARHSGSCCIFSLSFEDSHDALRILRGFDILEGVESAAIYRRDGSLFTEYTLPGKKSIAPDFDPNTPVLQNLNSKTLIVHEPIYDSGDLIGSIAVAYSTDRFQKALHEIFLAIGCILIAALLLSALVGRRFQRTISTPIERLSATARTVAETANFSLQAKIHAEDEIGQLARNFNYMLTEVQRRDHKLKNNEARFRTLVDEAVDAILLVKSDGILVDCNPMATNSLHCSRTELLKSSIGNIIPELTPEAFDYIWNQSFSGTHPTINTEMRRFDQTSYPAEIKLGPISQRNEKLLIAFCRDITERVKAAEKLRKSEEALQQSQKMDSIGQLAGGIAHDFNNMLAGIVSSAELLQLVTENENSQRYAQLILSAAKQASGLTEKLLTFSRKGVLAHAPFSVNQVVRDAIAILERSINPRIQIIEKYDATDLRASGDASLIQSVVLNLAINARDAMNDQGTLTVRTGQTHLSSRMCNESAFDLEPGPHIYIKVSDTGCGISPELQKRIFEPFFTTKQLGKGTGMGLSAVYGTIQTHNGAVEVESEEGEGSTFTILLPSTHEQLLQDCSPNMKELSTAPKGPGSILLIDDEEIIRTVVPEILSRMGYKTITAENGEEGIRKYLDHEEEIELVILDMIMPEMDGTACFSGLRRINPAVKIIIATGYAEDNSTRRLKREGAAALIKKPFDFETLNNTIMETLHNGEPASPQAYSPDSST